MKNIEKVTAKEAADRIGCEIKLVRAVVRQLGGKDYLLDVANHGAAVGFPGFTYYSDTVAFYKRNRAQIIELCHQLADDLGEDMVSMIAGFNCLRTSDPADARALRDEIGKILYGRVGDDQRNVANALAWFALEEVARAFQMCCEE